MDGSFIWLLTVGNRTEPVPRRVERDRKYMRTRRSGNVSVTRRQFGCSRCRVLISLWRSNRPPRAGVGSPRRRAPAASSFSSRGFHVSFSRAVLLGTLALGCASTPATDDVAPPALGVNPGRSWVATLRGLGSPIIGEIRISPAGSREMRAAISITGSDSGEEHPWHIHRGTCQSMVANAPVEG